MVATDIEIGRLKVQGLEAVVVLVQLVVIVQLIPQEVVVMEHLHLFQVLLLHTLVAAVAYGWTMTSKMVL